MHASLDRRPYIREETARLEAEGLARPGPGFVDATPLLERSHAAAAGLGFSSKAANLLHPRFGPWFFLAELVLDVDLEPTTDAVPHGSCGTCTACIDACPTDAILERNAPAFGRFLRRALAESPELWRLALLAALLGAGQGQTTVSYAFATNDGWGAASDGSLCVNGSTTRTCGARRRHRSPLG